VVTSVDGRYVWVTAQGSNALLAFRATGLRASPGKALAAVVPVGDHPIGAVEVRAGRQIVVANSGGSRNLMVVDTRTALCQPGHRAVTGAIPAGRGPRELSPEGSKALLVTNLGAGQLEAVSLDGLPQPGPGGPPPGCGG
jgi:DNA-binding beta-propeller fold protein YncE